MSLLTFALFLRVCVADVECEYIAPVVHYPTVERCVQQAAILAGMARGRYATAPATARGYDPDPEVDYGYVCLPAPSLLDFSRLL